MSKFVLTGESLNVNKKMQYVKHVCADHDCNEVLITIDLQLTFVWRFTVELASIRHFTTSV